MDAGAAQVEAADRRAVAGPAGDGAAEEELAQVQVAVKDVPLGQAEARFQIDRRQDVARDDRCLEAGRDFLDGVGDAVGQVLPLGRPVSLLEMIGGVLHERRQDGAAGRRQGRVDVGRDDAVDVRLRGGPAVLALVPGALVVLESVADGEVGPVGRRERPVFRPLRQDRGRGQGVVDLGARPGHLDPPDVLEKAPLELARLEQLQEGALRVGVARHGPRPDLLPRREHDTGGAALLDQDARHLGGRADDRA